MITSAWYWLLILVGVPAFWLAPARYRLGLLAIVSFGYLLTLAPMSVSALLLWSTAFYLLSPRPASSRGGALTVYLVLGILGYLAYFKYVPPLIHAFTEDSPATAVMVPLGISYFTFKLIHYAVEVRRGTIEDRSIQQFYCYIFLFPIFTAGPIERFDHFLASQEQRWSVDSTVEGLTRIVQGLIKKFILVEVILELSVRWLAADKVVADLDSFHPLQIWRLLVVTYLILYLDFSAYSDIAIGTARLFGLRIMENFNWPVLASDIVDFWRRWHMSLAGWVQTYVYMPLVGLYRQPLLALYTSFFCLGLWHAATAGRIAWGLYHATAIVVFVSWSRLRKRRRRKRGKPPLHQRLVGLALTQMFLVSSMAFLIGDESVSFYDSIRVLCKLAWIDVPG